MIEKTRIIRLKDLRDRLEEAIENCESMRDLAALSKQYRETIREIEELEGAVPDDDEIEGILTERSADGKPGAVRKDRTKLQQH